MMHSDARAHLGKELLGTSAPRDTRADEAEADEHDGSWFRDVRGVADTLSDPERNFLAGVSTSRRGHEGSQQHQKAEHKELLDSIQRSSPFFTKFQDKNSNIQNNLVQE